MSSLDQMEYDDIPDDAPDHIKMSVDLERYMEEEGLDEYTDEVMDFEEELVEAANSNNFRTNPKVAIAAAYRAATGERFEDVAEKFGVTSQTKLYRDDEWIETEVPDKDAVRGVYSKLELDEKELFDVPAHRRETMRSGQADLKEVAHTLHQELDEEMDREEVAEIYNKLH